MSTISDSEPHLTDRAYFSQELERWGREDHAHKMYHNRYSHKLEGQPCDRCELIVRMRKHYVEQIDLTAACIRANLIEN